MGRKNEEQKSRGGLFRRPKLTLSCSAGAKEGRKEGRIGGSLYKENTMIIDTVV
jgi:hypothetical protein